MAGGSRLHEEQQERHQQVEALRLEVQTNDNLLTQQILATRGQSSTQIEELRQEMRTLVEGITSPSPDPIPLKDRLKNKLKTIRSMTSWDPNQLPLQSRVYDLLGEAGTYYGVRFGKNIPWVTKFPFGYIKDPQYVGSILSLLGCSYLVPYPYILLWILGYLFMMFVESNEDPSTRAKQLA